MPTKVPTFEPINIGQYPNDPHSDSLRTAFNKINRNLHSIHDTFVSDPGVRYGLSVRKHGDTVVLRLAGSDTSANDIRILAGNEISINKHSSTGYEIAAKVNRTLLVYGRKQITHVKFESGTLPVIGRKNTISVELEL